MSSSEAPIAAKPISWENWAKFGSANSGTWPSNSWQQSLSIDQRHEQMEIRFELTVQACMLDWMSDECIACNGRREMPDRRENLSGINIQPRDVKWNQFVREGNERCLPIEECCPLYRSTKNTDDEHFFDERTFISTGNHISLSTTANSPDIRCKHVLDITYSDFERPRP